MTRGQRQIQRAEQASTAIKMRTAGMSYSQIGDALGVAKATVHRLTMKAIREIPAENLEALRDIEGARLEALWAAFYGAAMEGDVDAAGVLIRVSASRRRLFGLDVATSDGNGGGVVVQQIVLSPALALTPVATEYQPPAIEPPGQPQNLEVIDGVDG